MTAFGIRYGESVLPVSRVAYAIDFLTPWLAPSRDALGVPPGTRVREHTGIDESATHATGVGRVRRLHHPQSRAGDQFCTRGNRRR